jgi:hypothetical protein
LALEELAVAAAAGAAAGAFAVVVVRDRCAGLVVVGLAVSEWAGTVALEVVSTVVSLVLDEAVSVTACAVSVPSRAEVSTVALLSLEMAPDLFSLPHPETVDRTRLLAQSTSNPRRIAGEPSFSQAPLIDRIPFIEAAKVAPVPTRLLSLGKSLGDAGHHWFC